jgi:predicted DCC family thiol-disulfide oxidoreductase YuxK
MVDSKPQSFSGTEGRHLLLYDGVCGLCSRLVQFVLAHDRRGVFHFAPLPQLSASETTFYVIENYRTSAARRLSRGRAALFVVDALGWPWKMAGVFGVLPTTWLDRLYNLVARNRYRVFGRHDQCVMPRPEYRNRFTQRR